MHFDVSLCEKYYNMPAGHWAAAESALCAMKDDPMAEGLIDAMLCALEKGDRDGAANVCRLLRERVLLTAPEEVEGVYPAVFALALEPAVGRMRAADVPEEIICDTLSDYGIWARAYEKQTGRPGFGELGWEMNFVAGTILKLGRLQFEQSNYYPPFTIYKAASGELLPVPNAGVEVDENGFIAQGAPVKFTTVLKLEDGMLTYNAVDTENARILPELRTLKPDSVEPLLTQGMRTLNIHIPETGPLDDAEVTSSLAQAKAYFTALGYPCRVAVCESWLLDPTMAIYGADCGNLIRFLARFTKYPDMATHSDAVNRVFGRGTDASDPDKLPGNTRLQRGLRAFLKTGAPMRDAGGVLEL